MNSNGLIHHIEIYVSDLNKTNLFWNLLLVNHLGYTVHQKWDNGVSYIFDGIYIVFVQSNKKTPTYNRTHIGLNHLAFSVDSKNKLDEIRLALINANYTELYSDKYPHASGLQTNALYFEDPDRIKVEVVCEF